MRSILLPLFLTSAHAAVLVDWNLDTVTGPTENNTPFDGVTAATATVASGINVSDLTTDGLPITSGTGDPGLVWSAGNPAAGELNLQRWDRPTDGDSGSFGTGNGVPDNWLVFAISADAGLTVTIDTMTVAAWRNGGGAPSDWRFQISADGATWADFGALHEESNAGDGVFRTVDFNGSATGETWFVRFLATGPDGGSGNLHINDITLQGTIIPEPSLTLLGALGLFGLLRRRR